MATKTRERKHYKFLSPHAGEQFNIDIDKDNDASMFYVDSKNSVSCLLADVPKSEVILLLKEMIEKLEGGE